MGSRYDYGSWWTLRVPAPGRPRAHARRRQAIRARRPSPSETELAPGAAAPRLAGVRRRLRATPTPASRSVSSRHDGRPGVPRADHLRRPGGRAAGHRQPQGGAGGRRRRGRVPQLGRARRAAPGSATSTTPTTRSCCAPCADAMREEYQAIIDAGLGAAARRPGDRRELGPDQPGAERRGLPALHPGCASRRSTTPSAACRPSGSASTCAGAAGTARTRPTCRMADIVDADAAGQRRRLLVRGGQRAPRARVARLGGRQAARGQGDPARRSSATPPTWSSTPSSSPTGSCASPRSSVARTSSPSTDCGLGGRVHPQIAWAKLDALVQGAELATKRLWS